MNEDKIIIPMNETGERCFDVFKNVAMKLLKTARKSVEEFIGDGAEKLNEKAMTDGKYSAVYKLPDGSKKTAVYDYRKKTVEVF